MAILLETKLNIRAAYRGKVRDTYELGNKLLIVATDRISAFDFVLPNGIPDKGFVLNQISAFWFNKTKQIVPNHLLNIVESVEQVNRLLKVDKFTAFSLLGRSMLVKKAERVPVEAVVRGYISGSAWAEYKSSRTISGIPVSQDLRESQKLPYPIFTPTTKADSGHDLPLTKSGLEDTVGKKLALELEQKSLEVYQYAADYALSRGIIIADTKFEFGFIDGKLSLIDEILTPDSSRFWDVSLYKVGSSQPSYDKQPVRDWLTDSGWNKQPPVPELPNDVITQTTRRYLTAFKKLTGEDIKRYPDI
jgi:phosphoribosylaminoimidazole-succinocarboxamide synthase